MDMPMGMIRCSWLESYGHCNDGTTGPIHFKSTSLEPSWSVDAQHLRHLPIGVSWYDKRCQNLVHRTPWGHSSDMLVQDWVSNSSHRACTYPKAPISRESSAIL